MKDKKLIGVGIVGAAMVIGGIALAKRKPEVPPPDKDDAGISITILDSEGNPVPHNSPAELVEGKSYTAVVEATNRSTRAGEPTAATLETVIALSVGNGMGPVDLIPEQSWTDNYSANQTRSYSKGFSVPVGLYGVTGSLVARVFSPDAVQVAVATEPISVRSLEIAGGIGPGMIYYPEIGIWEQLVSGRSVPFNTSVTIAPQWINYSEVSIAGHVTLELTRPDGSKVDLIATQNQDKTANPGNGYSVSFASFTTDREGTYSLHAELSSDGQLLASVDFTLVVTAEIDYAANVVIGV